MAKFLKLVDGSVFNGNPITFAVQPQVLVSPSFHRMVFEVKCGMSGGDYETIKMSEPVLKEDAYPVSIDISSALRSFRDSYKYTPEPGIMPVVKFNVTAYDEYMTDGEVHQSAPVSYLTGDNVKQTIFGGFSDYERLIGGEEMKVGRMTRKPATEPHLACVGEEMVYAVAYDPAVGIISTETWNAPESKAETITQEGLQTVGDLSIYALPSAQAAQRAEFRFINSFGMLESISVPKAYSNKLGIKATSYIATQKETLHIFSRSVVKKTGNNEEWLFMTDPLTKKWLAWYLHEFLMAEHAWIKVNGKFLPCTLSVDDEITLSDNTKDDMYSVSFSAKLDFSGSTII